VVEVHFAVKLDRLSLAVSHGLDYLIFSLAFKAKAGLRFFLPFIFRCSKVSVKGPYNHFGAIEASSAGS